MAGGKHRARNEFYWRRPWSPILFAGDLFDAIPFSTQPTVVVQGDDDDGERKHCVGEIDWAYGLLVTPTCDMADQRTREPAHPALYERDEPDPRDTSWPPSPYDNADNTFAARLPAPDWDPRASA